MQIGDTGLKKSQYIAHPWHGISAGEDSPTIVNVFVEIIPTDTIKYELDKESGLLKVDRPQQLSSTCPSLYGFIPQTYCANSVGRLCCELSGLKDIDGDGDPLDICVLTERAVSQGNILLKARPIGGLRMIDAGKADDKIIAVLESDAIYGNLSQIDQCPSGLIQRLKHYFLSYKQLPDDSPRKVEITCVYDADQAYAVINAAKEDYQSCFS